MNDHVYRHTPCDEGGLSVFVPEIYRTRQQHWLSRIIRSHPLAAMVTNGPDAPYATYLPVISESETPSEVGATLLGHMNRANPHWGALKDGMAACLLFTGPNGYVSPTIYQTTPAAPTWNFAAVHLHGTLELFTSIDETLDVVRRTVATFEAAFGRNWDPEPSLKYFRAIVPGVGAFRFTVTAVDGQYKLSQEKDDDVQKRVIDWFAASENGSYRDLANIMREYVRREKDAR